VIRFRLHVPARTPALRWITLILLLGALLRIHAGAREARFHPDEAYFAGFAMRAALNGSWLLAGDLDKPPLAIYLSAASMSLFAAQTNAAGVLDFTARQGEFAARLPGVFSGILLIAVVYRLAYALYADRRVALTAAALFSLSPFAVGFSGSAFTDTPMLLAAALALWAAVRGRRLTSGIALALAVLCKFQAIYLLPLILMMLWGRGHLESPRAAPRLLVPLLGAFALLALWDSLRTGSDVLSLAAANNAPSRLIRSDEVIPRLIDWLNLSRGLFGAPTVLVLIAALLPAVSRFRRESRRRTALIDALLLLYTVVYFGGHWLVAFNTYDRYLLPLLIPLTLLGARGAGAGLAWISRRLTLAEGGLLGLVILLSMLGSAWNASDGGMLFLDDQSSFARSSDWADAAAYINAQPVATIVYDPWFGWELSYYLGAWSDKRRVYYPTPQALAAGALAEADQQPRFFLAPQRLPHTLWLEALADAGFTFDFAYSGTDIIIYRLIPPESSPEEGG
jgi:4-amino-4-deoxy-L-arabinose transferase-like glycosyltransferase